jgi:hypothetical protein
MKRGDIQLHEVTPATFLRVGFELEEQQYAVCFVSLKVMLIIYRRLLQAMSKLKSSNQRDLDLQDKRNALRARIEKWQQVQQVYMPGMAELRLDSNTGSTDYISYPERTPLHLPSSLPLRSRLAIAGGLVDKERRMRTAQADDALADLKRMLRITMGLWHYKHKQIGPSQRTSTRARTMINRYREKINRCADRYRTARSALLQLDPNGDWSIRLQELKHEDIKPPRRDEDDKSEGDREVSWIWMVQRGESDAPEGEASAGEVDDCKYFLYTCTNAVLMLLP